MYNIETKNNNENYLDNLNEIEKLYSNTNNIFTISIVILDEKLDTKYKNIATNIVERIILQHGIKLNIFDSEIVNKVCEINNGREYILSREYLFDPYTKKFQFDKNQLVKNIDSLKEIISILKSVTNIDPESYACSISSTDILTERFKKYKISMNNDMNDKIIINNIRSLNNLNDMLKLLIDTIRKIEMKKI